MGRTALPPRTPVQTQHPATTAAYDASRSCDRTSASPRVRSGLRTGHSERLAGNTDADHLGDCLLFQVSVAGNSVVQPQSPCMKVDTTRRSTL
eukprot:7463928-Pyramimonas_sp.AAC.1